MLKRRLTEMKESGKLLMQMQESGMCWRKEGREQSKQIFWRFYGEECCSEQWERNREMQ